MSGLQVATSCVRDIVPEAGVGARVIMEAGYVLLGAICVALPQDVMDVRPETREDSVVLSVKTCLIAWLLAMHSFCQQASEVFSAVSKLEVYHESLCWSIIQRLLAAASLGYFTGATQSLQYLSMHSSCGVDKGAVCLRTGAFAKLTARQKIFLCVVQQRQEELLGLWRPALSAESSQKLDMKRYLTASLVCQTTQHHLD